MELSPKFVVLHKLKEISRIRQKKGVEVSMVQTSPQQIFNVAKLCGGSLETMAMSRHQLENGQHRYRNVATSQQYVATSVAEGKD